MKAKELIQFLKENYRSDEQLFWQTYKKEDLGENINDQDWEFAIDAMSFEMENLTELLKMYIEESKDKRIQQQE